MIQVKNLTKRYGDHLALDNISFTVDSGSIVGFLGPNGAGKSTTMNIMTGYLSATDGRVFIDGIDVLEKPLEAKNRIGYLPEIPPLYNDMTVEEYLTFSCDLKGVEPKDQKAELENVCKQTKLTEVRGRLLSNLSKGYRQRVGLAQALIGNPPVLVLDEPTVGLDPKQIIEIRDLVRKLGKSHTVFLSSHILQEIEAVCDRIIIINNGRIIAEDTPAGLSKRLVKVNRLTLRVRTENKNNALAGISAINGVENAEIIRISEQGSVDIAIKAAEDTDVRADIFEYCVKTNQPILMLKSDEAGLEDIFIKLTEGREQVKR